MAGDFAVAGAVVPYPHASCEPGETPVALAGRAAERHLSVPGAALLLRLLDADVAAACGCRSGELSR